MNTYDPAKVSPRPFTLLDTMDLQILDARMFHAIWADDPNGEWRDNMAMMVKHTNAHDGLVELVRELADCIENDCLPFVISMMAIQKRDYATETNRLMEIITRARAEGAAILDVIPIDPVMKSLYDISAVEDTI